MNEQLTLWEVERILDELKGNLPQILLMENVPEVVGKKNIRDFKKWEYKLRTLGYSNYVEILNAKDFGIPQSRRRCYMVSILGDYSYDFPCRIKLKHRISDILEKEVDEKYFLSDAFLNYASGANYDNEKYNRKKMFVNKLRTTNIHGIAGTITTREGGRSNDTFIVENVGYIEKGTGKHQSNSVYGSQGLSPTLAASDYKEPVKVMVEQTLKKELCNSLVENGMVEEGDIVKHSYTSKIMNGEKKAIEKQGEMITLTTRGDCFGITVKQSKNLRIRKLVPLETLKLMGFTRKDYEALREIELSDANIYHVAGDSIVTTVLVSIFSNLINEKNSHIHIVENYVEKEIIQK